LGHFGTHTNSSESNKPRRALGAIVGAHRPHGRELVQKPQSALAPVALITLPQRGISVAIQAAN